MLVHAVRALATARSVDLVVVAAPEDGVADVLALLAEHNLVDAAPGVAPSMVVSGGETRQDSVARALVSLPSEVDVVLVHDAARPLVPEEVVTSVAAAVASGHPAVVPALPIVDTVKEVDGEETVVRTIDRDRLRAIQTPQGFDRRVLQRAHAEADLGVTDDAGLVEALGVPVVVVPGHEEALKVTRPFDLIVAEAIVARRRAAGVL